MVIRTHPAHLLVTLPALCFSLCTAATSSAQTTPAAAESFSGLLGGRTVSVIDDSGWETTGRLLLFTPDALTMDVNGGEVVIERKNVTAVFERGNSVRKGLLIGLATGPALWVAAQASGDAGNPEDAIVVLFLSAIGAGAGTLVDAMIPGKRLVYAKEGAFEPGDSMTNGLILGFVAGAAPGFVGGLFKDDCDHTPPGGYPYFDCRADEKLKHGAKVGGLSGLAGAGLGALLDKVIVGKRLASRPSISPSRLSLSMTLTW